MLQTQKYKYMNVTFSVSQYDTKVSVELPCGAELDEMMSAMKTLLVGIGYPMSAVENMILDQADEIRDIRNLRESRNLTIDVED